jgi:outer membrane scaffolding protein for murein synthesis (MipA/OmpV family)
MQISNSRKVILVILPLSIFWTSGSVFAQEAGWSFDAGVGVEYEPAYVGSDVYTTEAGVQLQASYTTKNGVEWFAGTNGVGVSFGSLSDTQITLNFEYEQGRDNANDPILAGFATVENTVEFQAVVVHDLGPFQVGVGLQKDILNRGKGFVGFVGAGYEQQITDRLSWNTKLDLSFADSTHMDTEVGISTAAAVASGLSTYKAPGGYKGASIGLGFDFAITDSASIVGGVSLETYGSAISNSPLVSIAGSRTTKEASLGLTYKF